MVRLGVVSFLNSRPLIEGLADAPDLRLVFDVPARLPQLLEAGAVDVALIPVIDVLRTSGRYEPVSDACIGADGETMTVRVFSQVPPDRIRTLAVDGDSHTSVALARVLWREVYGRELELVTIDARARALDAYPAVLLIGDKVIDPQRSGFAYEVDLGGAWRQHTGLPFTFALWARLAPSHAGRPDSLGTTGALTNVAQRLCSARDRGVARAAEIAEEQGPAQGWPVELARRYLTRCLRFKLDARAVEGACLFGRYCAAAGISAHADAVCWHLVASAAEAVP